MAAIARVNLIFIPTLLLSLALFVIGDRIAARHGRGRLVSAWAAVAALAAVPALLFAVYYAHLLDSAIWFYQFRSFPYSELLAAGLGLGTGLAAGAVRRASFARDSAIFRGVVPGVIVFCFALLLVIPYAKPVIAPVRVEFRERWSNGVCLQSTPSTCGPASAATLLRWFGHPASERALARECFSYGGGTENWYIARALRHRSLEVRYVQLPVQPVLLPFPSIAGTQIGGRGGAGHFIAILANLNGQYLIGDPIGGRYLLAPDELRSRYYFTGFSW